MTRLRVLRLTGAALIAVSATLAFTASGASAHNGSAVSPDSGDDRAVAFGGNATTCEDIGLTGATYLDSKDLAGRASLNDSQTTVTISSVPEGMTLTAIVVKGADGYNVYKPGQNGLGSSLPYTDLRSPTNRGGNIPTISHWFACAMQADTTGGGTGGTTGGTGSGTTGGTTSGTTGGTTAGTQQGAVDSATAPASASNTKQLANTGFNPTMPTILAVLLLLVGVLMLVSPAQILAFAGRLRRR